MYVEPGTIGQFLGIVSEEENMSDNNGNVTEEGNNEMFDRPEYDSEFYESDAVKALNLGDKLSAEDKEKLEALYKPIRKAKQTAVSLSREKKTVPLPKAPGQVRATVKRRTTPQAETRLKSTRWKAKDLVRMNMKMPNG